jgi:hypothetical protein
MREPRCKPPDASRETVVTIRVGSNDMLNGMITVFLPKLLPTPCDPVAKRNNNCSEANQNHEINGWPGHLGYQKTAQNKHPSKRGINGDKSSFAMGLRITVISGSTNRAYQYECQTENDMFSVHTSVAA